MQTCGKFVTKFISIWQLLVKIVLWPADEKKKRKNFRQEIPTECRCMDCKTEDPLSTYQKNIRGSIHCLIHMKS